MRDTKSTTTSIDCTSQEGLIIGLVDSITSCANVLHKQYSLQTLLDMETPGITEALKDMASNLFLFQAIIRLRLSHGKINEMYQTNELEKLMDGKK